MRVTRSLMLLTAVVIAAAGCAQRPVVRAQMVAAPPPQQGIDNVVYGPAPAYRTAAAPVYAPPAAPAYAMVAPPAYRPALAPAPVPRPAYVTAPVAPAPAAPIYAPAAAPAPLYAPSPVRVAAAPAYSFAPAPAYAGAYAPIAQPPYTLDSGDRLRVVVFGQDGLTNSYVLDASGQIQMPLIGSVAARGLTTDQLSERIAGMLRQGYVREPHVAVEIEAYRPFFILGEVTQPGQYPYVANMTVETAVAIAGGFSPRALHQQVIISRNVGGQVFRFEAPVTYQVRPGDTLRVQERWF